MTELDITDADSTLAKVKEIQPSVIYHCAAYTAVDKAEDEGKELETPSFLVPSKI
jgi:dTDP-4-dehydrorhamnose reductase